MGDELLFWIRGEFYHVVRRLKLQTYQIQKGNRLIVMVAFGYGRLIVWRLFSYDVFHNFWTSMFPNAGVWSFLSRVWLQTNLRASARFLQAVDEAPAANCRR